MAAIPSSGMTTTLAIAMQALPIYCAWGAGYAAWDSAPIPANSESPGLVAEIGRRRVDAQLFCTPSVSGDIHLPPSANNPGGRWAISNAPTPFLYLKTSFHSEDSPAALIREVGYFSGTVIKSSVSVQQSYFAPADLANQGRIFVTDRFVHIQRSPDFTQTFQFVMDFSKVFQPL